MLSPDAPWWRAGKAVVVIWRRWIFPLLLVVVLAAAAVALVKIAFFPDRSVAQVTPDASMSEPVITVERGSVVNALSLSGNIARDEEVKVRSEITGVVKTVHVADGAAVAAGQKLFTITQDDPKKDIDVIAPEAGDISQIALVKGQPTSIGTEIYTITPARYHALATVEPVQLYRLVNAPSEASITVTGGPAPFTCTGVQVEVSAEGTASVRCAIPTDQIVFAGLPATVDLALGKVDDAIVIPVTAVQGGSGNGNVWLDAGDGTDPQKQAVTLGVNDGTTVEVVSGLDEGQSIRQFVPGFVAPVQENCYEVAPGVQQCDSGMSW